MVKPLTSNTDSNETFTVPETFSGGLASLSASLLFHQFSRSEGLSHASLHKNRANQRVLIVGAGIAGLAAVQTLVDAGSEVVLIEARDRIGGCILRLIT